MTFASMTGFAESTGSHDGLRWRWEAKSVNGRSLDLRLRTPPGYDGLEATARRLAGERFLRGAFQISLSVEQPETTRGLRIDPDALASAVKIAREVAAETGLAPARVDGLLALKGVIVADEVAAPPDADARAQRDAAILESLAEAFDRLATQRGREGAKLAALMTAQMDEIEKLVGEAGNLAAAQPAALKARLTAQVKELLDAASLSEDRLAQEVALLAVKADVREELDRLAAHVHDARALIADGKGVGRKLDFLAQEFNREANTLCSKSSDIALTRTGLALKAVIDSSASSLKMSNNNIERRGLMLVLSSPSGAGKTTLSRRLLDSDGNIQLSVSATTRPMRPGEVHGKDYHFLTMAEFDAWRAEGKFLEHATVFGNRYGTPSHLVNDVLSSGRDVLFDIDWQGTQQLKEKKRDDLVSIFILPPSHDELERRLKSRAQDSAEIVAGRMAKAADEISHWPEYDYVIVNSDVEKALADIQAVLNAERLKRSRQTGISEFVGKLV